jgi:tetratricopeptide (TPR) repeat protein
MSSPSDQDVHAEPQDGAAAPEQPGAADREPADARAVGPEGDAPGGAERGPSDGPAPQLAVSALPSPADGVTLPPGGVTATVSPVVAPLAPSSSSPQEQRLHADKAASLPMTGEFAPLAEAQALPELPLPGAPLEVPPFARKVSEAEQAVWAARIQDFEREAEVLGQDPKAALLFLEIGRIYEEHLGRPRNAATSYQRAFTVDPRNPAVLHASRRLFTEVGNWGMVLEILSFEVEGAATAEQKASLLAEKGLVEEEKVKNLEAAQASYEAALAAWSAEPVALDALERIHLRQKAYPALRAVYERALADTTKRERRLPLLVAAAQLAEDRLEDPEGAIAHYQGVLALSPDDALALEALRRLYLATRQWEPYVEVLTRSALSAGSPEDAAQLLLTAGRALSDRLHDAERGAHLLLQALERAPSDLVILREIERLYEAAGRFDEVVKVLTREAEVTTEPRDKVPILAKLGSVLEERLGQPDDAVRALEEAVRLMPTYTPAKQGLGRLYGKQGRLEALAGLFEMEVRVEEDPAVRVAKLFQLADLWVKRLDKPVEGVAALKEVLSIQADYQPARKLLEKLLIQSEAWADLVGLYEQALELSQNRDQQVFLLTRIGTLAQDELGDLTVAAKAFGRILELVPGHLQAIRSLAQVAEKREDWQEVLRLHELEADATEDQKEVVAILHRSGSVLEEHVRDADGAIAQYEKALTLNPTYLPALRSLGRLYALKERWEDLLGMYRREMDVTRSEEAKVQLLFRSVDVLKDKLGEPVRAAGTLEQILELAPSNLPALRALAELHARALNHEALVDVLRREAATVADAKEKANLLMQAAELLEDRLGRADQAAEVYQDIIRLGQHVDACTRALVRIYSAQGLWNNLSQALVAAKEHARGDGAKAAILLRLAEVVGDKLGHLDRAAEHLEEALALDASNVTVLSQLERNSVARRDWPRALSVAKQLALQEAEPRLFAARQIRIAQIKETQLEPPESGAEHYRLALQTVPDHPVALRALELAYRRAGDWAALSAFYEREAQVAREEAKRATFYTRAGEIAESRLGDFPRALQMYERALELLPGHLPALQGRKRAAEQAGQAHVALDSARREVQATRDPRRREALLLEIGRLYEEGLQQVDSAVDAYRQILAQDPAHKGAFERLRGILEQRQDHDSQADLLAARAAAVPDGAEQASLLFTAGQVRERAARTAGRDPLPAVALYRQVLAREPNHVGALVHLGPLLFAAQDWDGAIEVFHKSLAVSKDPAVRRTALDSLGIIYHEHRQDLVKCVQSLQAALQIDPGDRDSLERLAKVYQEAQDWTSAVNVLLRLAEVQDDPRDKVRTLLTLAELYEQRLEDPRSAVLANRKVLELDPANQAAILRLSSLYEQGEDWHALADVSARYVSLLPHDQKAKAAPLHMKMAQVFETRMGDDARAINALKYALDAKPDEAEALLRLARLYGKSPEGAPHAVDAHRRLLRLDPFRVESYHEMHRLFERRGEYDKAFVVAEILVFLRSAHQDEELFYLEHKAKVAPHPEGALSPADHDRMVTHPGERGPLRAVMEILSPELSKAFPADLSRYDLNKGADRYGPKAALPLRHLADELSEALGGVPPFDLCVTKAFDLKVFAENDRPLALVVGANVGRRIQEKDQRFLLTRALEQLKGGHHLLGQLSPKDLTALVWAVAKSGNPNGQTPVDPSALEAMQRVLRTLPGRARRLLEEVGATLFSVHVDVERHRAAAFHTANRAALVMTNDIEVAVRNLVKDHPDVRPVFRDSDGARDTLGRIPAVRELLGYAVSEEYFLARAKLRFSIQ